MTTSDSRRRARAAETADRSAKRARLCQVALWFACGLVGAAAAWYLPLSFFTDESRDMPSWVRRVVQRDPMVGRSYVLPAVFSLDGHKVKLPFAGRKTALILIWTCETCGVDRFVRSLEEVAEKRPSSSLLVVVNRGKPDVVSRFWQENRLATPVAVDTSGALGRLLNAQFLFRAYVFDASGKLIYVSSFGESERDAILANMYRFLAPA
jgi:hypothetical protein